MNRQTLPLISALLLQACAFVPPPPSAELPAAPLPVPSTRVIILHEDKPADPAADAFRDIAGYASFNDNMLQDELARLETLADGSRSHDLRIAALLWMLDKSEHSGWLELLTARLADDEDPRMAAFGGMIGRALVKQRDAAERRAALESQLVDAQRRVEQLRAKIDALKSLEKELMSRPDAR